jgi:hypothetical protein
MRRIGPFAVAMPNPTIPTDLRGRWRITCTSAWVDDALDDLGPALLSITGSNDPMRVLSARVREPQSDGRAEHGRRGEAAKMHGVEGEGWAQQVVAQAFEAFAIAPGNGGGSVQAHAVRVGNGIARIRRGYERRLERERQQHLPRRASALRGLCTSCAERSHDEECCEPAHPHRSTISIEPHCGSSFRGQSLSGGACSRCRPP